MPQMMPMLWFFLFTSCMLLLYVTMSFLYFNFNKLTISKPNLINTFYESKYNWKWKW